MSKFYKGTAIEVGEYKAMVTAVEVNDNSFYDPAKPENGWNSPNQYTITFGFEDGQKFTQNFVRPDEDSLFGDLYELAEQALPEGEASAEINEQIIVGTECTVEVELNKKGYTTIYNAWAPDVPKGNPNATEEEKTETKEEVPVPAKEETSAKTETASKKKA